MQFTEPQVCLGSGPIQAHALPFHTSSYSGTPAHASYNSNSTPTSSPWHRTPLLIHHTSVTPLLPVCPSCYTPPLTCSCSGKCVTSSLPVCVRDSSHVSRAMSPGGALHKWEASCRTAAPMAACSTDCTASTAGAGALCSDRAFRVAARSWPTQEQQGITQVTERPSTGMKDTCKVEHMAGGVAKITVACGREPTNTILGFQVNKGFVKPSQPLNAVLYTHVCTCHSYLH